MNTFDLRLDLDKGATPGQVVRLRQGDHDGTTIRASVYDHGAALSGTVTACALVMKLPDGTHYYRKGASWSGGTATVTIDERQAAGAVGRTLLAYFTVTVGDAQYSTGAFAVVVEPDAVGDAELPEDYDTAIQDAIDRCNAAAAAIEGALPIDTANIADGAVTADKLADAVRKGSVRSFDTVAAMQAATDLLAGMTCHTNGFHASSDGGASYYTVGVSGTANGMDVLALQGGLFATLVVTEPYVTPEQFGAWGDGTHDDTEALQRAIYYSFQNRLAVQLTNQYGVSEPIKVVGVSATINGKGTELFGNGEARIITLETITNIIETEPETDTRAYGITIKNIILQGDNVVTNGLYSGNATSECTFENITILNCTNGLHVSGNCYLNFFRAVRPYHCSDYGILFENGNNTSNVFEKCYVDTCANAYKINGQYSTMISCCADNITGIVYDLTSFTGSLVGCGSEANAFETMFKAYTNSVVAIVGGTYFGNTTLSGYYFDVGPGAIVSVYSARINYASEASSGALCKLDYLARLTLKDTNIYRAFNGTNSLHATSWLYENTPVKNMVASVTLDANNEATIDLAPSRYAILNVFSTNRSGWTIIPVTVSNATYKVKAMSNNNYFPTISDKNFTLSITYVNKDVL